jgi:FtsP/CotA-like multicopper oxidase with cupredoxin domain
VLEPNESYDPARDLTLMVGRAALGGDYVPVLNGKPKPAPVTLKAGVSYRLRLINIDMTVPLIFELVSGDTVLQWRALSKDGAALPPALQKMTPARLTLGVGETYDFELRPTPGTEAIFVVRFDGGPGFLQQRFVTRP